MYLRCAGAVHNILPPLVVSTPVKTHLLSVRLFRTSAQVMSIPVSVVSQNFAEQYSIYARSRDLLRVKLNAVLSVVPRAKSQPLTVHRPDTLNATQLRILHGKYRELMHHEIDRLVESDFTWLAELEQVMRRDQALTFKQMRRLVTTQMNGAQWLA